jgi:hypothetical protein
MRMSSCTTSCTISRRKSSLGAARTSWSPNLVALLFTPAVTEVERSSRLREEQVVQRLSQELILLQGAFLEIGPREKGPYPLSLEMKILDYLTDVPSMCGVNDADVMALVAMRLRNFWCETSGRLATVGVSQWRRASLSFQTLLCRCRR